MIIDPNYNLSMSQNSWNGPVTGSEQPACQDILGASILAALASDKHMPGLEPREGNTTDAIQSTSSLLNEPAEDTSKKKRTLRAEMQTFTSLTQSYTDRFSGVLFFLGLIKNTCGKHEYFCHLPPHRLCQQKISQSIIKRYSRKLQSSSSPQLADGSRCCKLYLMYNTWEDAPT